MSRYDTIGREKTSREGRSYSGDLALLRTLGTFIGAQKYLLIIAAIFLLLSIGLELLRPILLKYVIDHAFPSKNMGLILQFAGFYFFTIVASMITLAIQTYSLERFGQSIIYTIRNQVFGKILGRTVRDFESLPIGNLVTRVTNDIESLRNLYTDVLLKLISSSLLILGMLASMYWLNWHLALVVTVLIPAMGVLLFVYQKYSRKAFRGVRTKIAASNTAVQEMLNFIVVIKTYVGERIMENKYDGISREYLAAGLYEVKTFAVFRPIVDGLLFTSIICVLLFTNWFSSVTDAGTVFAFLQYMNKLFQPIKDIADKYNTLQSSLAGAERLVPVLKEEEGVDTAPTSIPKEWLPLESIVFDHVYFSYPDGEEGEYALKDINLRLNKGDFLGIAGPSGGGKSTLMSLLMGFYRPTKGTIYINGHDTANYEVTELRELIGFVFQDSHLFKGSIRDNLCLYDDEYSEEHLEAAAKKAHLHETIVKLPQGYDTPVGYLGSLLSTGQKQLLGMARAFVKDKPVLIFDEATANIDSYTEQLIQDSIGAVKGDKTVISIAHRISTIQGATEILVIEQGEIVERGTFNELVNKEGRFYQLWQRQRDMQLAMS